MLHLSAMKLPNTATKFSNMTFSWQLNIINNFLSKLCLTWKTIHQLWNQPQSKYAGLTQLLFLIRNLYLNGMWVGVDVRTNTKKDMHSEEIGLQAPNLLTILGSKVNIIRGWGGGIWPFNELKNLQFDNSSELQKLWGKWLWPWFRFTSCESGCTGKSVHSSLAYLNEAANKEK